MLDGNVWSQFKPVLNKQDKRKSRVSTDFKSLSTHRIGSFDVFNELYISTESNTKWRVNFCHTIKVTKPAKWTIAGLVLSLTLIDAPIKQIKTEPFVSNMVSRQVNLVENWVFVAFDSNALKVQTIMTVWVLSGLERCLIYKLNKDVFTSVAMVVKNR